MKTTYGVSLLFSVTSTSDDASSLSFSNARMFSTDVVAARPTRTTGTSSESLTMNE